MIEVSGDKLPGDALDAMYEAWRGLPIADVVRTEFERIAREELARRGYYRATVRFDFPPETADLARVTAHVTRGPQTKRLTVAWTGNRDVPAADLDALVDTASRRIEGVARLPDPLRGRCASSTRAADTCRPR